MKFFSEVSAVMDRLEAAVPWPIVLLIYFSVGYTLGDLLSVIF
jgi:hypothetical protein